MLFAPEDPIRSYRTAADQVLGEEAGTERDDRNHRSEGHGRQDIYECAGGCAAGGTAAAVAGGGGAGGGGRRRSAVAEDAEAVAAARHGVPMAPGFNTVTWDLRYPGATSFPGMILWGGGVNGPVGGAGHLQIRMTADGRTQTQPMRVRRNPLFKDVSDADLQAQFDLAIQIRDKTSEANNAVIRIRDIKAQVAERLGKSTDARAESRGRQTDGESRRGRGGDLSGEEPERPGPAQLPDQGQQPAGIAAVDRQPRRSAVRSATRPRSSRAWWRN